MRQCRRCACEPAAISLHGHSVLGSEQKLLRSHQDHHGSVWRDPLLVRFESLRGPVEAVAALRLVEGMAKRLTHTVGAHHGACLLPVAGCPACQCDAAIKRCAPATPIPAWQDCSICSACQAAGR